MQRIFGTQIKEEKDDIDNIEDELEDPEEGITEVQVEQRNNENSIILIFVDDTQAAITVRYVTDQQKMQELIDRLGEWSKRWDLRFNVD